MEEAGRFTDPDEPADARDRFRGAVHPRPAGGGAAPTGRARSGTRRRGIGSVEARRERARTRAAELLLPETKRRSHRRHWHSIARRFRRTVCTLQAPSGAQPGRHRTNGDAIASRLMPGDRRVRGAGTPPQRRGQAVDDTRRPDHPGRRTTPVEPRGAGPARRRPRRRLRAATRGGAGAGSWRRSRADRHIAAPRKALRARTRTGGRARRASRLTDDAARDGGHPARAAHRGRRHLPAGPRRGQRFVFLRAFTDDGRTLRIGSFQVYEAEASSGGAPPRKEQALEEETEFLVFDADEAAAASEPEPKPSPTRPTPTQPTPTPTPTSQPSSRSGCSSGCCGSPTGAATPPPPATARPRRRRAPAGLLWASLGNESAWRAGAARSAGRPSASTAFRAAPAAAQAAVARGGPASLAAHRRKLEEAATPSLGAHLDKVCCRRHRATGVEECGREHCTAVFQQRRNTHVAHTLRRLHETSPHPEHRCRCRSSATDMPARAPRCARSPPCRSGAVARALARVRHREHRRTTRCARARRVARAVDGHLGKVGRSRLGGVPPRRSARAPRRRPRRRRRRVALSTRARPTRRRIATAARRARAAGGAGASAGFQRTPRRRGRRARDGGAASSAPSATG